MPGILDTPEVEGGESGLGAYARSLSAVFIWPTLDPVSKQQKLDTRGSQTALGNSVHNRC